MNPEGPVTALSGVKGFSLFPARFSAVVNGFDGPACAEELASALPACAMEVIAMALFTSSIHSMMDAGRIGMRGGKDGSKKLQRSRCLVLPC